MAGVPAARHVGDKNTAGPLLLYATVPCAIGGGVCPPQARVRMNRRNHYRDTVTNCPNAKVKPKNSPGIDAGIGCKVANYVDGSFRNCTKWGL